MVIGMICISDRGGSNRRDMRFTFCLTTPNVSKPIEIGVKTEEDLMQWVQAIRNSAFKPAVCNTFYTNCR